jgi:hypothetical protein
MLAPIFPKPIIASFMGHIVTDFPGPRPVLSAGLSTEAANEEYKQGSAASFAALPCFPKGSVPVQLRRLWGLEHGQRFLGLGQQVQLVGGRRRDEGHGLLALQAPFQAGDDPL